MQRALHVSASKLQMIPNFKKKAFLESISKNIATELLIKTAVRIVCNRQLTPQSDFLVTYIIWSRTSSEGWAATKRGQYTRKSTWYPTVKCGVGSLMLCGWWFSGFCDDWWHHRFCLCQEVWAFFIVFLCSFTDDQFLSYKSKQGWLLLHIT